MRNWNWMVVAAVALTACGGVDGDEDADIERSGDALSAGADLFIDHVGYGGTGYLDEHAVIFPEFFVIANDGDAVGHIGGWQLTDGSNWGGDGVAVFPKGTNIRPGEVLWIANYPPVTSFESYWGYQQISFEQAYGFAPDFEIAGWDDSIKDLTTIAGRIRLNHGGCDTDANCWTTAEQVWLNDSDGNTVDSYPQ